MSLISIFLASLLGSSHCIGMCGGIVLLYSQQEKRNIYSHLAYNFGRLNSYIMLGALAGLLGKTLDLSTAALGIGKTASVVFGIFLIAWGFLILKKGYLPEPSKPFFPKVNSFYSALAKTDGQLPPALVAYTLGLLSTLLPCGWLYMFAAVAAASGGILSGMLIMAIFWCGTLPYLLAVGAAAQTLLGPLRKKLPLITGILVILGGIFSISQHLFAFESTSILSGQDSHDHSHMHHH
jgi:hypothetical protein